MSTKMGAPLQFSDEKNLVAETRRKMGLSQKEFAAMLRLTHAAVSQFENGKRKVTGPVELLCEIIQKYPAIFHPLR